jgi:hypothetical protein
VFYIHRFCTLIHHFLKQYPSAVAEYHFFPILGTLSFFSNLRNVDVSKAHIIPNLERPCKMGTVCFYSLVSLHESNSDKM